MALRLCCFLFWGVHIAVKISASTLEEYTRELRVIINRTLKSQVNSVQKQQLHVSGKIQRTFILLDCNLQSTFLQLMLLLYVQAAQCSGLQNRTRLLGVEKDVPRTLWQHVSTSASSTPVVMDATGTPVMYPVNGVGWVDLGLSPGSIHFRASPTTISSRDVTVNTATFVSKSGVTHQSVRPM